MAILNTYTDSHCHIHESALFKSEDADKAVEHALQAGVTKLISIGTNVKSSIEAVESSNRHTFSYAVVGVHPHDSQDNIDRIGKILQANHENVVGIGEIGLDYYYNNSPRHDQIMALEQQLQWALDYSLPVSFHVRDAFDDFWPIYANYTGINGVLHSFTDSMSNLERGLKEGLYVGVNGISTFTKDPAQQAMFDMVPLERMLLETDAPFLTPKPHRGKLNEPAFVRHVAEYHAKRRAVELETIARVTSANASILFSI